MANTATWIITIVLYYLTVGLFVILLSLGNLTTTGHEVTAPTVNNLSTSLNLSSSVSSSLWDAASLPVDLIRYMVLGFDLGLGGVGNFIVTFIFGIVPGMILAILVYFAIRSGSS